MERCLILAPLRGVTIRQFRETFLDVILEAGFTEAFTPFIPANAGVDPLKNSELRPRVQNALKLTPQFIGKDPIALRTCLERIKAAGFDTADLNAGCPFPMVRKKGRGSGLLATPAVLEKMLSVGCETMGEGKFSLKTRLGVADTGELARLMPVLNAYPLRFITVHARTAKEMYEGKVHTEEFERLKEISKNKLVRNGDVDLGAREELVMVGRSFVRGLARRPDACELLRKYIENSLLELKSPRPVVGRMKELISYWKNEGKWKRLWPAVKLSNSIEELRFAAKF